MPSKNTRPLKPDDQHTDETKEAPRGVPLFYPRLVRFCDNADPKTVEKVDPANLAASFGSGNRLKRITAQIVDGDVTQKI